MIKKLENSKLIDILLVIGIVFPCLVYLVISLYTYPTQDDFMYTAWMNEKMAEGHNVLASALIINADKYVNYRGYYLSSFLYYFFDGIINCSVLGTRIFCFVSILAFYLSLYGFINSVVRKVMHASSRLSLFAIFCVFTCLNCTYYFFEHEIFYWMCSTQVSLVPLAMIFGGGILFIDAINNQSVVRFAIVGIIGILVGGSLPNIALIAAVIFTILLYWAIVVKKCIKPAILAYVPLVVGEMLNAFAPSSLNTVGEEEGELLLSLKQSAGFVYERAMELLRGFPIIGILFLFLLVVLLLEYKPKGDYRFPFPILFSVLIVFAQVIVTYPIILAYSYDVAKIMHRTLFVMDMFFYLSGVTVIFYWAGWIKTHIKLREELQKVKIPLYIALACVCVLLSGYRLSTNALYNSTKELCNGNVRKYSSWVVNIMEQVKNSDDDIVTIYDKDMAENTPLRYPYYNFDYYDPDTEYVGNSAMAAFYGKKAIFILSDDEKG